jgi:hypothetical protein
VTLCQNAVFGLGTGDFGAVHRAKDVAGCNAGGVAEWVGCETARGAISVRMDAKRPGDALEFSKLSIKTIAEPTSDNPALM